MCFCTEPKDRIISSTGKWGQGWVSSLGTSTIELTKSTALLYDPLPAAVLDAHGRKTSRPRQSHFIKLKLKLRLLSGISLGHPHPSIVASNLLLPVRDRADLDSMSILGSFVSARLIG